MYKKRLTLTPQSIVALFSTRLFLAFTDKAACHRHKQVIPSEMITARKLTERDSDQISEKGSGEVDARFTNALGQHTLAKQSREIMKANPRTLYSNSFRRLIKTAWGDADEEGKKPRRLILDLRDIYPNSSFIREILSHYPIAAMESFQSHYLQTSVRERSHQLLCSCVHRSPRFGSETPCNRPYQALFRRQ